MFLTLTHNENIPGLTTFASLYQRLNTIVLKLCELYATECIFSVQGLQYFHSSYSTGRISLNVEAKYYATEN